MSLASYVLNPELNVSLNKSKVENIFYNSTNPLPGGSGAAGYVVRNTNARNHNFDQASKGIFEQSIVLHNELNSVLTVTIYGMFNTGGGVKNGPIIWQGEIPEGGRYFFMPDKSESVTADTIIPLVELRMPYQSLLFTVRANTVPTSGELSFQNIRRY